MAYEENLRTITLEASGDLSSYQYRGVKISSGKATLAGDGEAIAGILQNKPSASGRAASIGTEGISKVECGAAVSQDDALAMDANGRAVTATTSDVKFGTALAAGSAAGSVISVLLNRQVEPLS